MTQEQRETKTQIAQLIQDIHQLNVDKGFWENGKVRNVSELCLLITSEICEALEDLRKPNPDKGGIEAYDEGSTWGEFNKELYLKNVKDTFKDEMADVFIRLCDYMGFIGDYDVYRSYSVDDETIEYMYKVLDSDNISEHLELLNVLPTKFVLSGRIDYLICMFHVLKDIDEKFNLSLNQHVKLKFEYNKTRGYKHGKKF